MGRQNAIHIGTPLLPYGFKVVGIHPPEANAQYLLDESLLQLGSWMEEKATIEIRTPNDMHRLLIFLCKTG
jgi:hypothetical protein